MTVSDELRGRLNGIAGKALIVGLLGATASIAGYFVADSQQFFQSYLQAYVLWFGIAGGSLGLLMIHHLVGGGWGFVSRRILEASVRAIPIMALFFIPIILGMSDLYKWIDPQAIANHTEADLTAMKSPYLNEKFFIIRSIVYFLIWMTLGHFLYRWSMKQDETGDIGLNRPMRVLSGLGLVLYGLTASLASYDWTMSLEPAWFSTMWGPLFFVGQGLSALAFTIILLHVLAQYSPTKEWIKPVHFHDIGNLMFAFVILWSYMSFSQFIIIWSGNLPEENIWYLDRATNGWKIVAIVLTIFHFALPFLILLSRHAKIKSNILIKMAVWILIIRNLDNMWVVAPTFQDDFSFHWLDAATTIGLGGIFTWLCVTNLKRANPLPKHDIRFTEEVELETVVENHG